MADPKEIIDFIAKSPIRVSVFGEFSAGKSTFLNALIGEEFLTVAVEPTTAVPTYIRYAREFNIIVNKLDKTELKLFSGLPPFWARFVGNENILNTLLNQRESIQSFLREWTKEGENANLVSNITIELPLSWLKTGIELVDTPGVNNEYTKHHHFTENVAKDTDIAIFLIDARQGGGKASEFEFMNVVYKIVSKSIIVVNKMDSLDEDEREDVLQNLKEYVLPKYWQASVPPMVFGLSALVRLGSPKAKSEPELATAFSKFISTVEEIVANERGTILLHRLRNPEKDLFINAQNFEKNKAFGEAHRAYFELYDILEVAGLDQTPAQLGIERTEKKLKEQVLNLDTINGKVNTSLSLEATDPDGALKLLYDIQIELSSMSVSDENVSKAIIRIQNDIHVRDITLKAEQESKQAFELEKTDPAHAITIYNGVIDKLKSIKQNYRTAETAISRCERYKSIFDTAKNNLNTAKTTSTTNPDNALKILTISKNELSSIDMTDKEIEKEILKVKDAISERERKKKEFIQTCSLNVEKALEIEEEKPEEALTLLQNTRKDLEPYETRLDEAIERAIDRCFNRLKKIQEEEKEKRIKAQEEEKEKEIKAQSESELNDILNKEISNPEETLELLKNFLIKIPFQLLFFYTLPVEKHIVRLQKTVEERLFHKNRIRMLTLISLTLVGLAFYWPYLLNKERIEKSVKLFGSAKIEATEKADFTNKYLEASAISKKELNQERFSEKLGFSLFLLGLTSLIFTMSLKRKSVEKYGVHIFNKEKPLYKIRDASYDTFVAVSLILAVQNGWLFFSLLGTSVFFIFSNIEIHKGKTQEWIGEISYYLSLIIGFLSAVNAENGWLIFLCLCALAFHLLLVSSYLLNAGLYVELQSILDKKNSDPKKTLELLEKFRKKSIPHITLIFVNYHIKRLGKTVGGTFTQVSKNQHSNDINTHGEDIVEDSEIPSNQGNVLFTSYEQVPWYRQRKWFSILCLLLFLPGLFILFTGDVYYKSKGQLKTCSKGAQVFILLFYPFICVLVAVLRELGHVLFRS